MHSTPPAYPNPKQTALLLLLSTASLLVHGYHPYVEDAEIYVPGILKILNPALYPYNQGFFASHARLTLFPNLIAASIRLTHVSTDWGLLLWHFVSIFLLLLACWHVGRLAFRDPRARWGGVALVGALLTIPVAGTALFIMDQYLNPRSLSASAVLFLVINVVERRFARAGLWILFTAAIHPLMSVFGVFYAGLLLWCLRRDQGQVPVVAVLAAFLPLGLFPPVTDAYREVLQSHSYFFLLRWEWYEWLGIFAPLALLWWCGRTAAKLDLGLLRAMCHALIVFALVFFLAGLAITIPARFANLAELQPMRCLHLVYVLLFVFAGGLLAQFVLRDRVWRWALLFLPLCGGMWFAQRQLFPATPHLEWPGIATHNTWVETLVWIRDNTPVDAYFALDPDHMDAPGVDEHGFRALAQRSMLADRIKDSGAVTMFPALAETWREQVRAQEGWKTFRPPDFQRLRQQFGVNWVVAKVAQSSGMNCPFQNPTLAVCRLD